MYSKYGFRSLRPPVSLQFLIKNSKEMGPEASGSLRPPVSLEFLIKYEEITPERPACFFLAISYLKQ